MFGNSLRVIDQEVGWASSSLRFSCFLVRDEIRTPVQVEMVGNGSDRGAGEARTAAAITTTRETFRKQLWEFCEKDYGTRNFSSHRTKKFRSFVLSWVLTVKLKN